MTLTVPPSLLARPGPIRHLLLDRPGAERLLGEAGLPKGLDTTLPPGLIGRLAGVADCSDAQIAAAQHNSGLAELNGERARHTGRFHDA